MMVHVCVGQCARVYVVVVGRLACLPMHFLVAMPLSCAFVCMCVLAFACFWHCVFLHVNVFRSGYLGNILMQE